MKVRLIEQLIQLNAVVKHSRREFKSRSWNIYIRIIVLFISLLILYLFFIIIFIVQVFILIIYGILSLVCVFIFKLFAMYVLNILAYMNRQQQPRKTVLICCRDAQADLGLRCPHMQKESFSHDMSLS